MDEPVTRDHGLARENRVTWDGGGDGEVARVDDLHVTVLSSKPFPPGAPARGALHTADGPRSFTLKVAGSRRVDAVTGGDGAVALPRFEVRGRLVSATVDVRDAFVRVALGVHKG